MNSTEHNRDAALTEMFGQRIGRARAAGDDADPDQIGRLVHGNRVHAAVHQLDFDPGKIGTSAASVVRVSGASRMDRTNDPIRSLCMCASGMMRRMRITNLSKFRLFSSGRSPDQDKQEYLRHKVAGALS